MELKKIIKLESFNFNGVTLKPSFIKTQFDLIKDFYSWEGLVRTRDSFYDSLRETLSIAGVETKNFIKWPEFVDEDPGIESLKILKLIKL